MISADVESEDFGSDARVDPWDPSMVVVMSYVGGGVPSKGWLDPSYMYLEFQPEAVWARYECLCDLAGCP